MKTVKAVFNHQATLAQGVVFFVVLQGGLATILLITHLVTGHN